MISFIHALYELIYTVLQNCIKFFMIVYITVPKINALLYNKLIELYFT